MKRMMALLAAGMIAAASGASAQTKVSVTRLDCGTIVANDLNRFSDTDAYVGQSRRLTASCYLIRHGNDILLWDAGLPAAAKGKAIDPKVPIDGTLTRTVVEQLAELGIRPEQVGRVGISHYHFDHTGQADAFPTAMLLIGAGDWAAVSARPPAEGINVAPLAPWLSGGAKVDPVTGDRDVFGDGTVRMLDLPGHTPGHHALLVKLKDRAILLSGDLAHFAENYTTNGVPAFNTDRAATLASIDRFKKLAANLKATVIIQHDPADIAKLPAFPKAAE